MVMNELKKQLTQNPSREDVHEQREHDQPHPGVVTLPRTSTPTREHEKKKSEPPRSDRRPA